MKNNIPFYSFFLLEFTCYFQISSFEIQGIFNAISGKIEYKSILAFFPVVASSQIYPLKFFAKVVLFLFDTIIFLLKFLKQNLERD
jgi:hypothetical protein